MEPYFCWNLVKTVVWAFGNPQTTPSGVVTAVINIEMLGWNSPWKGSSRAGWSCMGKHYFVAKAQGCVASDNVQLGRVDMVSC